MPKKNEEALRDRISRLLHRMVAGEATEQERIDLAADIGELGDVGLLPTLFKLLEDPEGQVRYYALQAAVLDLDQKDETMAERCWQLLASDPDEDVRRMAAACLGATYAGERNPVVFARLLEILKQAREVAFVKGSVYNALFAIAGCPPLEWPGVQAARAGRRRTFEETDIDWQMVAVLEDRIRAESES